MSIIHKYLTLETLKYFGMLLTFVVSVYIAVDFFEKIDDFIEAGLPFSKALTFFLFKIPLIISQVMPVCILLSVLIVFGLMTRNYEIVALKSSGVSIYYLLRPVFAAGLICGILLFFLSEVIVPITIGKSNRIWLREVRKEHAVISSEKNIWIKGNRSITHIKYYNSSNKTILGVSQNTFDENFRLIRRIDARKGVFKEGKWILHDLVEQNFVNKDGTSGVVFYENRVEQLGFLADDLKRVMKLSGEMSLKELFGFIKKVESEGYDATIYKVDFYAKIAFPFICIIMCIVGTGIGVRGKAKDGLPVSIAYGIGIAFLYWIFYSFCLSLGYGEMLHPIIAAWTSNLVFFCLGVLTLMNAE
ncbi:LPS export ABC transporter permease LptG [Thermodesulfobacteriota bacterium]